MSIRLYCFLNDIGSRQHPDPRFCGPIFFTAAIFLRDVGKNLTYKKSVSTPAKGLTRLFERG